MPACQPHDGFRGGGACRHPPTHHEAFFKGEGGKRPCGVRQDPASWVHGEHGSMPNPPGLTDSPPLVSELECVGTSPTSYSRLMSREQTLVSERQMARKEVGHHQTIMPIGILSVCPDRVHNRRPRRRARGMWRENPVLWHPSGGTAYPDSVDGQVLYALCIFSLRAWSLSNVFDLGTYPRGG